MPQSTPDGPSCTAVRAGRRFGSLPRPRGIDDLVIEAPVGPLTALRARPEAGEALGVALLIPGFTGCKEDFYDLMPLLAGRGWDVWAFSQRGQADSVAPQGVEAYHRAHTAQDALDVARIILQATGADQLHLLGHSFGGVTAQAALLADPHPFRSLTLLDSGPHGWPGRHADIREHLAEHPNLDLWSIDNLDRAQVPDSELSTLERFLRERSRATSRDQLIGTLDQLESAEDHSFEIRDTGVPVLVAHGAHDVYSWPQTWLHRMARIIDARLEIIPDAAHCPNGENPAATARVLDDFWTSQNDPATRRRTVFEDQPTESIEPAA
ncbi:alpha/beta fold hydrolase [Bifidobacterium scardovii]|uniref:Hydrolase, alpha/beta domain protein n=1 Tax=Bifidobacterium scardovii TaxID=158787 RepID=A0A087D3H4_9BIFI|nr:alpha/beta hydrolase [Bifidobacterium scardovii]KFI90074.1 hydrolase, alpha/beta domain protein [Bifidobacterium scardovii]MDK6349186.1 alpha/beta hydrolase [Bifidobacterium scardovii]MDU8980773.1 alpha/beta hydrolase [Bifidobacterium scardovii]BAQ32522.1 putative hydrolase [Bifidobacterium scardovii JCM 12489 = DSM 13734]